MSTQEQFTIERLCKYLGEGKLMGAKCKKCGKIHFPPRPLCDCCLEKEFEWIELPQKGKLLTYTIIHIAPPRFQSMTPYAMGIVQLGKDLKVPGMIKNASLDQIKIGMPLKIAFEPCSEDQHWPKWPRYHFEPTG